MSEFENAGVKVKDILVYKNKWEKFELTFFIRMPDPTSVWTLLRRWHLPSLKRRMIKTEANACVQPQIRHAILNWWRRKFSASLHELLEGKSMTVGYPGIIIPL